MSFLSFQISSVNFYSSQIDVSCRFEVDRGVVHIIGKNGVGKTSMLKAIMGIYKFEGQGYINGKNITSLTPTDKKMLSYCPDKYAFSDDLTPLEYLEFVSLSYGIADNSLLCRNLLIEFGVDHSLLKRKINQLSYGTIKKVLITATLISDAKIILMDEPTNGLDKTGKSVLREYINGYREDHIFIIICHDEKWISQYKPTKVQVS